jgi:hypothetical protein
VRIYLATTYTDDGYSLDLISVALAADDGREFYAVSEHASLDRMRQDGSDIAQLPIADDGPLLRLRWDYQRPGRDQLMPRAAIMAGLVDFIAATPDPELWAEYGAHDFVAFCQLWGSLADLPGGDFPRSVNDLAQEWRSLGRPPLDLDDPRPGHALAEARYRRTLGAQLAAQRARMPQVALPRTRRAVRRLLTPAAGICDGPYTCPFPAPATRRRGDRWTCPGCGSVYRLTGPRPPRWWRGSWVLRSGR